MNDDDLATFMEQLATHLAHARGVPVALVWPEVRQLVSDARQEYRDAGAPLGDTDQGFIQWINERCPPALTA